MSLLHKHWWYVGWMILVFPLAGMTQKSQNALPRTDILAYKATIQPLISEKKLIGQVAIRFKWTDDLPQRELILDCGNLTIDSVLQSRKVLSFRKENQQLIIKLPFLDASNREEVVIHYQGHAGPGIQFFPEDRQVFTVFSTNHWMPCRKDPEERAKFSLDLILPQGLEGIGNGKLTGKKTLSGDRVQYSWKMRSEVPAYCFGFAAGGYNQYIERAHGVKFRYLSANYSEMELQKIFATSPDMLRFFERKAGVRYPGKSYTQILPKGGVSQEMHHFTVIRNNYGKQILENPADVNLAAHELAHQWWGNQVTCKNWNHFWLNEGLAVFMSTAYREYRFGRKAYQDDISVYYKAYAGVSEKDLDKPLVFPNWDNPTAEDRVLVYYKGAYLFHLLREELGDKIFWKALRRYTKKYFGRSVISRDLQRIMEKASGKDLSRLFNEWVFRPGK